MTLLSRGPSVLRCAGAYFLSDLPNIWAAPPHAAAVGEELMKQSYGAHSYLKKRNRELALALIFALVAASLPAAAGQRQKSNREDDYYAYAGGDRRGAQEPTPISSTGGCFVTLSPTEAARGIRHFREHC